MLKLKLQYFGHLMQRTYSLEKILMLGKTEGRGRGQGGLACCSPWGHKELDTTEQLNWTEQGMGLPWWLSGKESACQCRRHRFNPWVRKIPWQRKWKPTPIFLPGKLHGHGAWRTIVHGVATSWIGVSYWAHDLLQGYTKDVQSNRREKDTPSGGINAKASFCSFPPRRGHTEPSLHSATQYSNTCALFGLGKLIRHLVPKICIEDKSQGFPLPNRY